MRWYTPWGIPNSAVEAFIRVQDDQNLERVTWPSIGLWEEYGTPQDDAIVLAGASRAKKETPQ